MLSKLTVIGCFLLTAFVVHTAVRIEHLNVVCGMFLPMPTQTTSAQWRIPELHQVLQYVDFQIANRRSNQFTVDYPDKQLPEHDEFVGAPYSAAEQNWIDRSITEHAAHTRLRWWVLNLGALQYVIAPLAFVWAVGNFLVVPKLPYRIISAVSALLAFAAIFLMIFRGY